MNNAARYTRMYKLQKPTTSSSPISAALLFGFALAAPDYIFVCVFNLLRQSFPEIQTADMPWKFYMLLWQIFFGPIKRNRNYLYTPIKVFVANCTHLSGLKTRFLYANHCKDA